MDGSACELDKVTVIDR